MDTEMKQSLKQLLDNAHLLQKGISEGLDKLSCERPHQDRGIDGISNNVPGFSDCMSQLGKDDIASDPDLVNKLRSVMVFKEVYTVLESLVNKLVSLVNKWKRQFQLHYSKLILMVEPDLEEIAPWCAKTGKVIHDLLQMKLRNSAVESLHGNLQKLLTRFFQSTFLVSKQETFFVKTETKTLKKFYIRALAADYWYDPPAEVTAHFLSECDLRLCFHGDDLDLQMLKAKEVKLTVYKKKGSSKHELKTEKGKNKLECCVQNLKFEKAFKRQQKKDSKQLPIHEEKFRLVFITKMESMTYWTVSLPFVVITASSQEANSLASIMWQCFATNVYTLQEGTPESLPWSEVATMLKMKISTLSQFHSLSPENVLYLKFRLLGKEDLPNDASVSLNKFCCADMKDVDFSFWRWFLGIYNLIHQHLSKYWNDGLIMGFLKKQAADQMLLKCDRSGTFILRFSDTHLIKRDGLENTLGHLTASSVVCKKNKDTELTGGKRKITGQTEVNKEMIVGHTQIGKADCPPGNLANILKTETKPLYRYLYPGDKSREELFDKYCEESDDDDIPLPGYIKSKHLPAIEDGVRQLHINEDNGTALDSTAQLGPTCLKKLRCNEKGIGFSTSSTSSESGQGVSSFADGQNQNLLQSYSSPKTPLLGPSSFNQIPEQFVSNLILQKDHPNGIKQDSVVPNILSKPDIPMIHEDFNLGSGDNGQDFINLNSQNTQHMSIDFVLNQHEEHINMDQLLEGDNATVKVTKELDGTDGMSDSDLKSMPEGDDPSVEDFEDIEQLGCGTLLNCHTTSIHDMCIINNKNGEDEQLDDEADEPRYFQNIFDQLSQRPGRLGRFLSWVNNYKEDTTSPESQTTELTSRMDKDELLDSMPSDLSGIDFCQFLEMLNEDKPEWMPVEDKSHGTPTEEKH